MSKFKTGDMVKILHTDYSNPLLQVGCVCTVVIDEEGDALLGDCFFYDDEVELVITEPSRAERDAAIIRAIQGLLVELER